MKESACSFILKFIAGKLLGRSARVLNRIIDGCFFISKSLPAWIGERKPKQMFRIDRQKQNLFQKAYENYMFSSLRLSQRPFGTPVDYFSALDLDNLAEEKEHIWGRLRS